MTSINDNVLWEHNLWLFDDSTVMLQLVTSFCWTSLYIAKQVCIW